MGAAAAAISMRSSPNRDSPVLRGRDSINVSNNGGDEVILIEDFDEALDTQFLNDVVKPYFKTIFQDVAMRRHSPKKTDDEVEFIDKVAPLSPCSNNLEDKKIFLGLEDNQQDKGRATTMGEPKVKDQLITHLLRWKPRFWT